MMAMHLAAECSCGQLREEISSDTPRLNFCLSHGSAFVLKDKELPYELLIDMDSFIFETSSLYEIMGKFLVALFAALFDRSIKEAELQSVLSNNGIDTRWIEDCGAKTGSCFSMRLHHGLQYKVTGILCASTQSS